MAKEKPKQKMEMKPQVEGKEWWVDSKGKRIDGRSVTDLRDITIKAGVLPNADGSCYLEWGQNKVLVSVHGPRECLPKHQANPYKATVRYNYRMATFSVTERKNPRPGRREVEISKVSGEALERAIFLEKFPNTAIDIFVEVLDANAGTRIACLTAAAVAVADAGIPMRDLVTGITVGRAEGNALIDLNKHEEDAPDAVDMAVAFLPNNKEVVLLQMDGEMSSKEFANLMELAADNVSKVYELQKAALKESVLSKSPEQIPGMDEVTDTGAPRMDAMSEEEQEMLKPRDPMAFHGHAFEETKIEAKPAKKGKKDAPKKIEADDDESEEDFSDEEHAAYDAGKE